MPARRRSARRTSRYDSLMCHCRGDTESLPLPGKGAPIVLYALHMQRMTGHGEVAITAAVLKEKCGGIDRKTRNRTLAALEAAGFATVRRRGKKFQGCPLLTLHPPEPNKAKGNEHNCQPRR